MLFKLFRKPSDVRPRVERDSSLAEELARRVNSIEFQPSRGFLKDQRQPKRSTRHKSKRPRILLSGRFVFD
jgi:hypothetical protein